jgi:hypothetical protein
VGVDPVMRVARSVAAELEFWQPRMHEGVRIVVQGWVTELRCQLGADLAGVSSVMYLAGGS